MKIKVFIRAIMVSFALMMCALCAFSEEKYASTREEVVSILSEAVLGGQDCVTIAADQAIYDLLSDGKSLFDIFNEAKIATAEHLFYEGVLTLSQITAYPDSVMCASVEDAVKAFESKAENVCLHMTESFYESFTKDGFALFFKLDGMAGIRTKECVYYADTRFFIYTNIEYYEYFAKCETRMDFSCALQNAENHPLNVYLEDALFSELTVNDNEELKRFEIAMKLLETERAVNAYTNLISYASVSVQEKTGYIESVDDLEAYIAKCASERDTTIRYMLSERMYEMVESNNAIEFKICAQNGIFLYTYWSTHEDRTHMFDDIRYYPGAQIVYALQNDCMHILSQEEKRLYEEAEKIARKVLNACDWKEDRELWIERELIREIAVRCEYFLSEEDAYNTAVGAILYGKADCDGYADALYLIGNLAGLHVEYQIGNIMDGGTHMWNVVENEYGRYFTDATGCDMNDKDFPDLIRYDWMDMGLETAGTRYIWQRTDPADNIDHDNPEVLKHLLSGNVFSSTEEARAFLNGNTAPSVYLAITGIEADGYEKCANDVVYGFGGPYFDWMAQDVLHISLVKTWFACENFYDCSQETEVIEALKNEHDEIILRLNEEMFETYLADGGLALSEMEKAAGIQSSQKSFYESTRVFLYNDIVRK